MKKLTFPIMALTCITAICSSSVFANNPRYGTYYPPQIIHCTSSTTGKNQCDIPNDVAPYLTINNKKPAVEGDYYLSYALGTIDENVLYEYKGTNGRVQLYSSYTGIGPDTSTGDWWKTDSKFFLCKPAAKYSCPFTNVPFMPKP